jgi:hypothetical protein
MNHGVQANGWLVGLALVVLIIFLLCGSYVENYSNIYIYLFIYVNVENNLWAKYGFCRFLLHLVVVGVDSKPTQQYRGPSKYGDLL